MKPTTAQKLLKINREFYEKFALSFASTRNNLWEKEILDFCAKIKPKSSILDLGCGNARLYQILSNQSIKYLGIDSSKNLIAMNQERYGNNLFKIGDGLKLTIKNKFNYVISIAVLQHIPSKKLQLQFLKNIYTSLKPKGKILITIWNRWQDKYKKYFNTDKPFDDMDFADIMIPWRGNKNARFIHAFKPDELHQLAEESGFKNIKCFTSKYGRKTNINKGFNIYLIGKK